MNGLGKDPLQHIALFITHPRDLTATRVAVREMTSVDEKPGEKMWRAFEDVLSELESYFDDMHSDMQYAAEEAERLEREMYNDIRGCPNCDPVNGCMEIGMCPNHYHWVSDVYAPYE